MKLRNGALVMVVDGAKLLLFQNAGDEKYPVFETLLYEEDANLPSREQGTDTPGRTRSSSGERRSSYEETDWHEQAEGKFARHAATILEQTALIHKEAPIVIVSARPTLGEIRKHYGRETKRRLIAEIGKDLAGHITEDIEQAVKDYSA